jgi:glycosyltransferase involved in cell wall biosynthesis
MEAFVESLGTSVAEYAASQTPGGVAEARNLALARCDGLVVMLLDADDQLTDGAVARVISGLESGHMWCGFAAIDDRAGVRTQRDGGYSMRLGADEAAPKEAVGFVAPEWVGQVRPGAIRGCWNKFGMLPFHPATFATYARRIWEVGGWPGLSRDEDTALILAITDRHGGVVVSEPNVVYRHHAWQTSRLVIPNDERIAFIQRRTLFR